MFDINTNNHILINLYALPADLRKQAPVRITNREFARGWKAGTAEAAASEVTGQVYSDTEIVGMLTEFFSDSERTDESLYFSIGALFGQIFYTSAAK